MELAPTWRDFFCQIQTRLLAFHAAQSVFWQKPAPKSDPPDRFCGGAAAAGASNPASRTNKKEAVGLFFIGAAGGI